MKKVPQILQELIGDRSGGKKEEEVLFLPMGVNNNTNKRREKNLCISWIEQQAVLKDLATWWPLKEP